MAKYLKLSIDVDGVLRNFCKLANSVINGLWPGRIPEGYVPDDWTWTSAGITKHDWDAIWNTIAQMEDFWLLAEHYPDNVAALRDYLETNRVNEVFYVTSMMPSAGMPAYKQTQYWLEDRGLVTNCTKVIVVPKGVTKQEIYRVLGIQASVDDYWENVVDLPAGHFAALLDRPWNKSLQAGYYVVPNLSTFLKIVEEL